MPIQDELFDSMANVEQIYLEVSQLEDPDLRSQLIEALEACAECISEWTTQAMDALDSAGAQPPAEPPSPEPITTAPYQPPVQPLGPVYGPGPQAPVGAPMQPAGGPVPNPYHIVPDPSQLA